MANRWVSKVVAYTGPRGGGKTLGLTVLQIENTIKAYHLGHNIWSNYPVGFYYRNPVNGKKVYLCPKPLNMEALYTFEKGLVRGWVFIDEVDKWLDRQEWGNTTSKIITQVLTMIRHRELSMGITIQSLNWLNARGQFQVDAEAMCRDAAFTSWGKGIGLQGGEVINLTWKDLSGIFRGQPYEQTFQTYQTDMRARWAWNTYDTYYEFNPVETKATYHQKKKEYEIGIDGKVTDLAALAEYKSQKLNESLCALSDVVRKLQREGITQLDKAEFRFKAKEAGVDLEAPYNRGLLRKLNIGACGSASTKYNIEWADDILVKV